MKMIRKYGWLCAALLAAGCSGFISVDPPTSSLTDGQVFAKDASANAAMTAVYAGMTADALPFHLPAFTGLYGDEMGLLFSYPLLEEFRQNALNPTGAAGFSIWNNAYKYIYQANAVLEGCEASGTLSTGVREQLKAEARFARAFWHFVLVNLYGDVPIATVTDYRVNMHLSRSPAQLVYAQIVSDLQYAVEHLPAAYVDNDGNPGGNERVRPVKWAAAALLARIYLYTEAYREAEEMSTMVIWQTTLYDTVPVHQVFLKNNREAIWQLAPSGVNATYNTQEGYNFAPFPGLGPLNGILSTGLMASFEPGDYRKAQWTKAFTGPSGGTPAVYYPYKYKVKDAKPLVEYSTVLRLAEQYLIRAEARAKQQNLAGAAADLNLVRKRAGLGKLTPGTEDAMLAAILQERRVELFCEYGHRWFDLKRTGKADAVMAAAKGATWAPYKKLWPLAKTELEKNGNLSQNPGYPQ